MKIEERLLANRRITANGCWEWIGGTFSNGYGRIRVAGKDYGVHRISAIIWLNHSLFSPLEVMHKCDNKLCFNPEHLEIGTRSQNMKDFNLRTTKPDWRTKGKKDRTECKNGHPWKEENLFTYNGYKGCRICRNLENAKNNLLRSELRRLMREGRKKS